VAAESRRSSPGIGRVAAAEAAEEAAAIVVRARAALTSFQYRSSPQPPPLLLLLLLLDQSQPTHRNVIIVQLETSLQSCRPAHPARRQRVGQQPRVTLTAADLLTSDSIRAERLPCAVYV